jgi:hypothetical protein
LRRVTVRIRIDLGSESRRRDLPREGDRLGPLAVVDVRYSIGVAELALRVRDRVGVATDDDDLAAIESSVAIVRAEVDKQGWHVDGADVVLGARP